MATENESDGGEAPSDPGPTNSVDTPETRSEDVPGDNRSFLSQGARPGDIALKDGISEEQARVTGTIRPIVSSEEDAGDDYHPLECSVIASGSGTVSSPGPASEHDGTTDEAQNADTSSPVQNTNGAAARDTSPPEDGLSSDPTHAPGEAIATEPDGPNGLDIPPGITDSLPECITTDAISVSDSGGSPDPSIAGQSRPASSATTTPVTTPAEDARESAISPDGSDYVPGVEPFTQSSDLVPSRTAQQAEQGTGPATGTISANTGREAAPGDSISPLSEVICATGTGRLASQIDRITADPSAPETAAQEPGDSPFSSQGRSQEDCAVIGQTTPTPRPLPGPIPEEVTSPSTTACSSDPVADSPPEGATTEPFDSGVELCNEPSEASATDGTTDGSRPDLTDTHAIVMTREHHLPSEPGGEPWKESSEISVISGSGAGTTRSLTESGITRADNANGLGREPGAENVRSDASDPANPRDSGLIDDLLSRPSIRPSSGYRIYRGVSDMQKEILTENEVITDEYGNWLPPTNTERGRVVYTAGYGRRGASIWECLNRARSDVLLNA